MSAVLKDETQGSSVLLPPDRLRFSPADGSFVPLSGIDGKQSNLGYMPPDGMFCEFSLVRNPTAFIKGITAQLRSMGPWRRIETVFVCTTEGGEFVYFARDVNQWRQMANVNEFTDGQKRYLIGTKPITQADD